MEVIAPVVAVAVAVTITTEAEAAIAIKHQILTNDLVVITIMAGMIRQEIQQEDHNMISSSTQVKEIDITTMTQVKEIDHRRILIRGKGRLRRSLEVNQEIYCCEQVVTNRSQAFHTTRN